MLVAMGWRLDSLAYADLQPAAIRPDGVPDAVNNEKEGFVLQPC